MSLNLPNRVGDAVPPITPRSSRLKSMISWMLPVIVILAILDGWLIGLGQRPRAETTDIDSRPGASWTFPVVRGGKTTHPILLAFQRDWGHPGGDFRLLVPGAWKARMTALHGLARLGKAAIPPLLAGLDDEDREVRDLCAQALGYFGDRTVIRRLDRAIYEDPDATVRIYAAISRAAIGGPIPKPMADHISQKDPNPLVRMRYELLEDKTITPSHESIRTTLAQYDLSRMDSARLGQPAPDFTLSDLQGKEVRLSDYRGKKNVVLVFLYGATCMYCSGQMSQFRAHLSEFESRGVQVILVEANAPYRMLSTLRDSRVRPGDPPLPFLSDPSHTVAASYGVAMQMNHIEWLNRPATFLIDREGVLRKAYLSKSLTDRPSIPTVLDGLDGLARG